MKRMLNKLGGWKRRWYGMLKKNWVLKINGCWKHRAWSYKDTSTNMRNSDCVCQTKVFPWYSWFVSFCHESWKYTRDNTNVIDTTHLYSIFPVVGSNITHRSFHFLSGFIIYITRVKQRIRKDFREIV